MFIHLKSRGGMYRLIEYNTKYMIVATKNYTMKKPIDDFRCLAGGDWNRNTNPVDVKKFMWFLEKSKERTKVFKGIYDYYNKV